MEQLDYNIREYRDSDLIGVLALWEHHSGWGRPETKEYRKWIETPCGKYIVLVAEGEKEQIVGQLILTPTELFIYGKKQKGLKMSAPIIHSDFRSSNVMNTESLMIQISLKAYQIAQKKNYEWFYNFPAAGWSKIMRLAYRFGFSPWKINFYECYEILDSNIIISDFNLQILDKFPDEIKIIWERFKERNNDKSFVTRDLKWLNYKWGDDFKVGIYNSKGKLDGYAVIKKQSGLILDFVVLDYNQIPGVLIKLKQLFDNHATTNDNSNSGLKFMMTPFFAEKIPGDFLKPVNYEFVFGLCPLNDFVSVEKLSLEDWYVFPND